MSNPSGHGNHSHDKEPKASQHGFVLLGDKTVYGGHLAMFHMLEHKYQVIIQMTLGNAKDGSDAREKYVEEQKKNPETPFIVVNPKDKEMLLRTMIEKKSFPAEIWKIPDNNFDKKEVIATGLTVKIDKVLHDREFNPNDEYPGKSPRYVLFGSGGEAHMTHYMTKDRDYQLLVDLDSVSGVPEAKLRDGVEIDLENLDDDHKAQDNPLKKGQELDAVTTQDNIKIKLKVGDTHWFDFRELNNEGHGYYF